MKKRLSALLLVLAMMLSLLPAAAAANSSSSPIVFTKTIVAGENGQPDRLKLEAYVTGDSSSSVEHVPTDIVLVLDQSGSMDETIGGTPKLTTMKNAVTTFVNSIADLNTAGDDSYRVAVVGFASESGSNTEILTVTSMETVTSTSYVRVTDVSTLDTDETYWIRDGEDYRRIRYFGADQGYAAGWYTYYSFLFSSYRLDFIDVEDTAIFTQQRTTATVPGDPGVSIDDLTADHYAAALVDCTQTTVASTGTIGKAVAALDGNGATRADLGMEMADSIFDAQPSAIQAQYTAGTRKKVVIMLTDGEPTTSNTFSGTVANDAISHAKHMKDTGAHIFSLYMGNPSTNSSNFMKAVSSNYPDATSYTSLGEQKATSYYAAHNSNVDVTNVFRDIVFAISSHSTLNESSVTTDVISEYFRLPMIENGVADPDNVKLYTVDMTSSGWATEEVPFTVGQVTFSNDNKTIQVEGFNFSYHCVTSTPKNAAGDMGRKLVIYIPIIADSSSDNFGGWLPTNAGAGIYEVADDTTPAITVPSAYKALTLNYSLIAAERAYHVDGTLLTDPADYDVVYADIMDDIFDEMITRVPNSVNNAGADMVYRLYDTKNTDPSTGGSNDDVCIATLTVPAGENVDVTDASLWTWISGADGLGTTITIPANELFAEKIYVMTCTLTSKEPVASPETLMVVGKLDLSVVRGDLAHIVYGTIDEGGNLTVPAGAAGSLIADTYTEAVTAGEDSALMIFTPKAGYEIASITYFTSTNAPFDTPNVIYSADVPAVLPTVGTLQNGVYTFQALDVTSGVAVEVATRPIQFTLTTEHDQGSTIRNGSSYSYDATEKLDVYFNTHDGYKVSSLTFGETKDSAVTYTAAQLLAMSQTEREALGIYLTIEDGDILRGEVQLPKTRDNYAAVTSEKRVYTLTFLYYLKDGSTYTLQNSFTEQYEVAFGDALYLAGDPSRPAYLPGAVRKFGEDNYTLSEWYNHYDGVSTFTGITNVQTATMPASDLTLHAYGTKNPDVNVGPVSIEKKLTSAYMEDVTFSFVAMFHEHQVGTATVTVTKGATSATVTMEDILLTDAQFEQFKAGNGAIYLHEVAGSDVHWIYDNARYELHYDAAAAANGYKALFAPDGTAADKAVFTNNRLSYKVTYKYDSPVPAGAPAVPAEQTYAYGTIVDVAAVPTLEGHTFSGWTTDVAVNEGKFTVTKDIVFTGKWDAKEFKVTYKYDSPVPAGAPAVPAEQTYAYGTIVDVAAVPSLEGHTFSGWTTDVAVNEGKFTVTKDIVFTGKWDAKEFKVTYKYDSPVPAGAPAAPAEQTYAYGAIVDVAAVPSLAGYIFSGWKTSDVTVTSGKFTVTKDIVFTGKWTLHTPPVETFDFTLIKVDETDKTTTLKGAKFEVYRDMASHQDSLVGTYTTDANGKITLKDLPAGNYYAVEIAPPEGYSIDHSKHSFTVKKGGESSLTITNQRTAVPGGFSDDHYAYIIGYPDGNVRPQGHITRAEVATIFFRLLDDATRAQYSTHENDFSDVNRNHWFSKAVSTLTAMGIIYGRGDGTFDPNGLITRAEFAAIAARFDHDGDSTDTAFSDIYTHWGQKEINISANNGWVLGYEDGTFRPNELITRAEAVTMVNRVLQRIVRSADDLLDGMIVWPDNRNKNQWYYLHIQEATNSHDYRRVENGYEIWTALKPNRDWAALERE